MDLIEIFDHFGVETQIEKLREEVEEFIEAVKSGDTEHMEEEFADISVMIGQFAAKYKLNQKKIVEITFLKIDRTVDRIETGYYEKELIIKIPDDEY